MSNEKEFRPRFTKKEIQFMIAVLHQQRKEFQQIEKKRQSLKWEVNRLHRLFVRTGSYSIFKELQQTKKQLAAVNQQTKYLFERSLFCNVLFNRFKAILEGSHKHRPYWFYKKPEVAVPIIR